MASAVAVVSTGLVATGVAVAQDDGVCDVGFSANNMEQTRWQMNDIPNMEQVITDGGGTYTWFDARLDSAQQQTDVETIINGGADVLVLPPQNPDAPTPHAGVGRPGGRAKAQGAARTPRQGAPGRLGNRSRLEHGPADARRPDSTHGACRDS